MAACASSEPGRSSSRIGPTGRSAAWQRTCFGSRRSAVRIRPPRPITRSSRHLKSSRVARASVGSIGPVAYAPSRGFLLRAARVTRRNSDRPGSSAEQPAIVRNLGGRRSPAPRPPPWATADCLLLSPMLLGLLVQVIVIAVEDHLTRESVGKLGRTTRLRHNVARHAGRARPTVPPTKPGPRARAWRRTRSGKRRPRSARSGRSRSTSGQGADRSRRYLTVFP